MSRKKRTRIERDSMGVVQVPRTAYYGATTCRAVNNFPVSGLRLQRSFVRALALIKSCAALVNHRNGLLSARLTTAIRRAADETASGRLDEHFVVDVFQTGSGTSTNMNMNEVIANRAIELLGGKRGDRNLVHPNDHVNAGMSSNDAIPTATHVAAILDISEKLLPALLRLERALETKSREFHGIIKTGRTHLQDATPIRLGQEFTGYAGQIDRARQRIMHARQRLCEVALGGTAVGTGVNTTKMFANDVLTELSKCVGFRLHETGNHFQAQSTLDEVVFCSGALKTAAVTLMKIANDIRWLGSGPRSGLGEIRLPETQPGSSIMPGKVNPVIPEAVCQVAAQVVGNDAAITIAGQSGNFELNVMQPVAAYNLLQSINLLANVTNIFREKCIDGLEATERGPLSVETGLALCTALVPAVGYDRAAAIAHEASRTGETVRAVSRRMTTLSDDELTRLLDPFRMTEPAPDAAPDLDKAKEATPNKQAALPSKLSGQSQETTAATGSTPAVKLSSEATDPAAKPVTEVSTRDLTAGCSEAATPVARSTLPTELIAPKRGETKRDEQWLELAIGDWESEGGSCPAH